MLAYSWVIHTLQRMQLSAINKMVSIKYKSVVSDVWLVTRHAMLKHYAMQ